ncbi:hypothetical protein PFISCL1PPCAC_8431, partial [Pristionchus fissidentatus]
CPVCEAPFKSPHRLSMHILAEHRETDIRHFRCDDCDVSFRTLEILRKHRKKHDRSDEFKFGCDQCGIRFTSWTGVVTHQIQTHGQISDRVRELKPEPEK